MTTDYGEIACGVILQHLLDCVKDLEFEDVLYDSPDADDLTQSEFEKVADLMRIAKVDIKVKL